MSSVRHNNSELNAPNCLNPLSTSVAGPRQRAARDRGGEGVTGEGIRGAHGLRSGSRSGNRSGTVGGKRRRVAQGVVVTVVRDGGVVGDQDEVRSMDAISSCQSMLSKPWTQMGDFTVRSGKYICRPCWS